jgi:hypothetical protein
MSPDIAPGPGTPHNLWPEDLSPVEIAVARAFELAGRLKIAAIEMAKENRSWDYD